MRICPSADAEEDYKEEDYTANNPQKCALKKSCCYILGLAALHEAWKTNQKMKVD